MRHGLRTVSPNAQNLKDVHVVLDSAVHDGDLVHALCEWHPWLLVHSEAALVAAHRLRRGHVRSALLRRISPPYMIQFSTDLTRASLRRSCELTAALNAQPVRRPVRLAIVLSADDSSEADAEDAQEWLAAQRHARGTDSAWIIAVANCAQQAIEVLSADTEIQSLYLAYEDYSCKYACKSEQDHDVDALKLAAQRDICKDVKRAELAAVGALMRACATRGVRKLLISGSICDALALVPLASFAALQSLTMTCDPANACEPGKGASLHNYALWAATGAFYDSLC